MSGTDWHLDVLALAGALAVQSKSLYHGNFDVGCRSKLLHGFATCQSCLHYIIIVNTSFGSASHTDVSL